MISSLDFSISDTELYKLVSTCNNKYKLIEAELNKLLSSRVSPDLVVKVYLSKVALYYKDYRIITRNFNLTDDNQAIKAISSVLRILANNPTTLHGGFEDIKATYNKITELGLRTYKSINIVARISDKHIYFPDYANLISTGYYWSALKMLEKYSIPKLINKLVKKDIMYLDLGVHPVTINKIDFIGVIASDLYEDYFNLSKCRFVTPKEQQLINSKLGLINY